MDDLDESVVVGVLPLGWSPLPEDSRKAAFERVFSLVQGQADNVHIEVLASWKDGGRDAYLGRYTALIAEAGPRQSQPSVLCARGVQDSSGKVSKMTLVDLREGRCAEAHVRNPRGGGRITIRSGYGPLVAFRVNSTYPTLDVTFLSILRWTGKFTEGDLRYLIASGENLTIENSFNDDSFN